MAFITAFSPLVAKSDQETDKPAVTPELPELTIEQKILEAFPDAPIMLSIARCESGNGCQSPMNPEAKNPNSSAKGLFQILDGTWLDADCKGDVLDAEDNIACARKLYDSRGTNPWNASKHGWGKYWGL